MNTTPRTKMAPPIFAARCFSAAGRLLRIPTGPFRLLPLLLLAGLTGAAPLAALDNVPANSAASTATKNVLKLLAALPSRVGVVDKCISGQMAADIDTAGYYTYVTALKDLKGGPSPITPIGKYVGVVGLDYCVIGSGRIGTNAEINTVNDVAIRHWKEGGLVTISAHFRNPWTNGDSWDRPNFEKLAELYDTTSPTSAYVSFHQDLDQLAWGLAKLRDNLPANGGQVVVLLRLFHEFNGGWFWWGRHTGTAPAPVTAQQLSDHKLKYIDLWRHVFDYLTRVKGLNNLLFVWGGDGKVTGNNIKVTDDFYPGNWCVDIAGFDYYHDQGKYADAKLVYDSLNIPFYNKPIAILECGREPPGQDGIPSTHVWDNELHIKEIKLKMPGLVYFLNWMAQYSIIGEGPPVWPSNTSKKEWEMMRHGWTFNVDDGGNNILHGPPTW